ncbi:MAG TPA: signal peptidase I [Gaiellaceae bacterium]|nr:signal peptidase I [Gaiellaceae bacterium]
MTTRTAYDYYRWQPRSSRRRAGTVLASVLCAACLALAGLMILPGLLGYQRYVITSGSMTGTYDRGSVVFDSVAPVSDLKVGDVITYTPPPGSGPTGLVTHRIAWIGSDQFGRRVLRTKGDANEAVDPWTFTLDGQTQARVSFHVPYVGYALAALSIRKVRMLVVALPALLIAVALVASLRRDVRKERIAPEVRS